MCLPYDTIWLDKVISRTLYPFNILIAVAYLDPIKCKGANCIHLYNVIHLYVILKKKNFLFNINIPNKNFTVMEGGKCLHRPSSNTSLNYSKKKGFFCYCYKFICFYN